MLLKRFSLVLILCLLSPSFAVAAEMVEIRYQDHEADQSSYISRILVLGERMRIDFGRDEEDFLLYDRRAGMVWHVAHAERRLTGIVGGEADQTWPVKWKLVREKTSSENNVLSQLRVNDQLCVEFKSAPILSDEARMLRDFRRALARNQAAAWRGMPEDLREPCSLALDVNEAGAEYRLGLPLAIRYWDGRSRIYQSHEVRPANPDLFELPIGYARFVIGGGQKRTTSRQPNSSQRK